MKAVIYQYWDGEARPGVIAGSELMKQYADAIGVDYIFELNPQFVKNIGKYSAYYGAFKPIYDRRFYDYDYVLFADTDVIPVAGLKENIFDQFVANPKVEIGICEEWDQPDVRLKFPGHISNANDEKWASLVEKKWGVKMPRASSGLLKVFNSGVVVYSNTGLIKASQRFTSFDEYVRMMRDAGIENYYAIDQPYLHAMLDVGRFNWMLMDYKWNSSVHYKSGTSGPNRPVDDLRNNSNFVHVQLHGKHWFDKDKLNRIANLPVDQWGL